ncbi:hypothetical protein Rhopal_005851-T1 [Rhodotorula paludigena]|uniref:Uncharacterized protein n=1 Tax=Rhodotorula paludigena TaxID=86838 RepID=A0AAV5GW48_9BASI|nr:hypothetical protein Rhopal_005851-T1 [Rhodotorula paludigena]
MHGLVPASAASSGERNPSQLPESLLEPIISAIPSLPPRPGLVQASELLLSGNFRLMAATNGALETTRGLFAKALGETKAQRWEYFSCDEDRVAKPAPSVYRDVWRKLGVDADAEKKHGWFVASHTWDLFAAKKAGFKTALVTYEEHLVLEDLFGQPDIVAPNLEELARQIIAAERRA